MYLLESRDEGRRAVVKSDSLPHAMLRTRNVCPGADHQPWGEGAEDRRRLVLPETADVVLVPVCGDDDLEVSSRVRSDLLSDLRQAWAAVVGFFGAAINQHVPFRDEVIRELI